MFHRKIVKFQELKVESKNREIDKATNQLLQPPVLKFGILASDISNIEARGQSLEQVIDRLEKTLQGPGYSTITSAVTSNDIAIWSPSTLGTLASQYDKLESHQIPLKFTSASGAASRMFKAIKEFVEQPAGGAGIIPFIKGLEEGKFAFKEDLAKIIAKKQIDEDGKYITDGSKAESLDSLLAKGKWVTIAKIMVETIAKRPKALIPFHFTADKRPVLPIEEHMQEALNYAGGKLHLTVAPPIPGQRVQDTEEHAFRLAVANIKEHRPDLRGVDVSYSVQSLSSDSPGLDLKTGKVILDASGKIAFFPAGHGALIQNLLSYAKSENERPVVLRNIDNIPNPKSARDTVTFYHKAMAVKLRDLKANIATFLNRISDKDLTLAEFKNLVDTLLKEQGLTLPVNWEEYDKTTDLESLRAMFQKALNNPLRILGVVKNEGAPGGGPFIIKKGGFVEVSILEKDEIADKDMHFMEDGDYFNPVDILVDFSAISELGNENYLQTYVDSSRFFVVKKTYTGNVERTSIELPGLWNGAMSGNGHKNFITYTLELPLETFAPVKQVVDLLGDNHQ